MDERVGEDAPFEGRTALWEAVHEEEAAAARALQEAGADVLHVGPDGWTPWRLSLVGRVPGLLDHVPGLPELSSEEAAEVDGGRALMRALGDIDDDGWSIACVPGLDAADVVRRLGAAPASDQDPDFDIWESDAFEEDSLLMRTVGVTTVPGGSVVCQPWAYMASTPVVAALLSAGTVCYSMYANPKSGNQGSITRDGVQVAGDLHPGGGYPDPDDPDEVERFRDHLYRGHAAAYCCAFVGVAPPDARAVVGPPDLWVELPVRDYWAATYGS